MLRQLFIYFFLFLSVTFAGDKITIAYYISAIQDTSIKDKKISLEYWVQELGNSIDLKVSARYYKDIHKFKKDFEEGKIDMIVATAVTFAKYFDPEKFETGFIAKQSDNNDELVLITSNTSGIKTLKDLRGKKLSILKSDVFAKIYFDMFLLKKFHLNSERFFSRIIKTNKRSVNVLKVFFKKADAALVTAKVYKISSELNPQIRQKTKILKTFSLNVASPTYFRKGLDPKIIQKIKKEVFRLSTYPRGKEILTVFKADRMVECSTEYIYMAKNIYQTYRKLINKYKGK